MRKRYRSRLREPTEEVILARFYDVNTILL